MDDNRPMRVCRTCLMAIESHEGPQYARHVYTEENDCQCEWCGDDGFDELYEI